MTYRYLVIDTETTGFKKPAGIAELAFLEFDENLEVLKRTRSLIDPQLPIEPGASGVHGITNQMVADAPTLEEFLTIVEDHPFDDGEIVVVAHNAAYDMQFVGPLIPNLAATVCTLKCARKIYPEADDHKLQTLRYWLELDVEEADAHSAMGDVEVTFALLKRLMKDSGLNLAGLAEISKAPTHITKMGFGKHKGTKLEDLPGEYVSWLLNKADIDPDLRYALTNLKRELK